ncbi:hypothetical protein [Arthrobacter sp. B0490]|uniref:hypothetical protein n=1 Tax=Arthrobacter sp. B0490 TaxID=2058891 RepID=UPI000CE49BEA|nr:hypothetical protein [Arthrobacter sp. B0490]
MTVARDTQNTLMRHGSLGIDPVFYEIIWLGRNHTRVLSAFPDTHLATRPTWRVIAGYLMLSSPSLGSGQETLGIFSHGRPVGQLTDTADGAISLRFDSPPHLEGQVLHSTAGIAVITDPDTTISIGRDEHEVLLTSPTPHQMGFTFVHGPAAGKVENRIRLLHSLRRLKGDHG